MTLSVFIYVVSASDLALDPLLSMCVLNIDVTITSVFYLVACIYVFTNLLCYCLFYAPLQATKGLMLFYHSDSQNLSPVTPLPKVDYIEIDYLHQKLGTTDFCLSISLPYCQHKTYIVSKLTHCIIFSSDTFGPTAVLTLLPRSYWNIKITYFNLGY